LYTNAHLYCYTYCTSIDICISTLTQREAQFVLEFAFPGQFAQIDMPAAAIHAICSTAYITELAATTNTEITTDVQCGCVRVRNNSNKSSSSSSSSIEAAIKQLDESLQQWRKLHGVVKFEAWMLPSITGNDANRFLNIQPVSEAVSTTDDYSNSSSVAATDDTTTADSNTTNSNTATADDNVDAVSDESVRAERAATAESETDKAVTATNGKKKHKQRQQQQRGERVNISCDRSALEFHVIGKSAAAVTSVCEQLQAQLQELAKEHAVVSVPLDAIARLVGRQGSNIKALQTETSARFDIDSKTGVVHITGKESAVHAATEKLSAFTSAWQREHTALTITVPEKLMSVVIGRGGGDIRALQDKCKGVQIDIDRSESTVHLYGNADGVACAQQHIQSILDADAAQQAAAKQARVDRAAAAAAAKLQQQQELQQQKRELEQQQQQQKAAIAAATIAAASAAVDRDSNSSKMVIKTDADVLDCSDDSHHEQHQSLGTTSSDATDHDNDDYDDHNSEHDDTEQLQNSTGTTAATTDSATDSVKDATKHDAEHSAAPTTAAATSTTGTAFNTYDDCTPVTTAVNNTAVPAPSISALTSMLFGSSSPVAAVTSLQQSHKPLQSLLLPTTAAPQKEVASTAVTSPSWAVSAQAKSTTTAAATVAAAPSLTSLTDLLMKGSNSTTNANGAAKVATVDTQKAAASAGNTSVSQPKTTSTTATTNNNSSDSDRYYISRSGVKLRL
jgi:rRNA processing protein Krr1/Pno1